MIKFIKTKPTLENCELAKAVIIWAHADRVNKLTPEHAQAQIDENAFKVRNISAKIRSATHVCELTGDLIDKAVKRQTLSARSEDAQKSGGE